MLYVANVPLQIKGSRVEIGEQFELTEEEAAALDPKDMTPADAIPQEEPEDEDTSNDIPIDEMSVDELKARAEELGLPKSGTKADLQERIKLHMEGDQED